jgi:hypothetical protein
MNLLRILVFVVMITSLLAFQVKSAGDERTRESPQIQFILASALFGPFGAAGGLWYRHLLTQILTGTGTPLEPELVCQDLHKPGTQQLLAISTTLALLLLHGIRSEVRTGEVGKSDNLAAWVASTLLIYTSGAIGAKAAAYGLCQGEQPRLIGQNPQKTALDILAIAAITTGIVAALGFNLIWLIW